MKHPSLLLLLTPFRLSACGGPPPGPLSLPLQERLRNPLVAERYWAEMVEHMADYTRRNDPIMKDGIKAAIIESTRQRGLERVTQARALKKEGMNGLFLKPTVGEEAEGEVLLRNNTLSFGTAFMVSPGPSAHVYLSTILDPRIGSFPDESSIDLGDLQTAYGAQEYLVPESKMNPDFRTVVIYDTQLKRLIGFAQLAK